MINQHYCPCAAVGQCGTPHCADRGALQPAALSPDDVRAAVWVLRRPICLLRLRQLVQFLPQQLSKEPPASTHRHRSVLRVPLFTHPAGYQRQVSIHRFTDICHYYFPLCYSFLMFLTPNHTLILHSLSLIPRGFDSRLDAVNCKRVNVAGSQAASYLQRLLQLKYPGHLAAITLSRVEELLHEHSYTAVDYHEGAVCQCKHTYL